MSGVLLEEVGPNGNVSAVVEAVDDVCYFYLSRPNPTRSPMKTVWVANYSQAPDDLEIERMKSGYPPRNPKKHCRHPQGRPPLRKDELRIGWLPEGDGAALYEGEELLAIIPPWSGLGDFHGFARDCVGDGPVAWEIGADNALVERFRDAEAYWRLWEEANPWPSMQSTLLTAVEETLGRHSNYYAIDGDKWPPKAMVRIKRADSVVLVTIGMSARPQPAVEMATEQPELFRRIELGVVLPSRWPEDAVMRFASYLSAQSGLPWNDYTWLGPGHTIRCGTWQNPNFEFVLLQHEHPAVPTPSLGPQFDDPVNILWAVPISAPERQVAMEHGSERLRATLPQRRWEEA